VLKKTIVFITHDFDEAIRLADRIAIMKDGEIIQIGKPEELVSNPATDYVAKFTQDVNRARVLSAGGIMRPASPAAASLRRIRSAQKVESFAAEIVERAQPFAVEDAAGMIVGEVTPRAVIDVLTGKGRGANA